MGAFSLAGYPIAGLTWMRGVPKAQNVAMTPFVDGYGDLRLLVESRLGTTNVAPTLAVEVGRASGLVARSAERAVGATGGFFLGASAGARY